MPEGNDHLKILTEDFAWATLSNCLIPRVREVLRRHRPSSPIPADNRRIGVYLPKGLSAKWKRKPFAGTSKFQTRPTWPLRSFLGAKGMKKGDLSKFIAEAVRWRIFHRTVQDIKAHNADADPDEIQRIVDEAVTGVRAECRTKQKADRA